MQRSHHNSLKPQGRGITGIGTAPKFAISQRALLVQTSKGNLLWDCLSLIDEATTKAVRDLGGISAIAISHPHYYSSMVEWSEMFGNVPIYLHADDQRWVMRSSGNIVFWKGEQNKLFGDLTLIRCGGHFEGGTVLHWADGEDRAGALLTGDIIQVVQDRRFVSFMWSYPNYIPLPASAVIRIVESVRPFGFKRLYGIAFGDGGFAGIGVSIGGDRLSTAEFSEQWFAPLSLVRTDDCSTVPPCVWLASDIRRFHEATKASGCSWACVVGLYRPFGDCLGCATSRRR